MNLVPTISPASTACSACGNSFACGAATGNCWCMALPHVTPMPANSQVGCLCRECLGLSQAIQNLPAVAVAYFRQVGPYGPALNRVWATLSDWARTQNRWTGAVVMYGISHHYPLQTPPELCRYDACIEVPRGTTLTGGALYAELSGGPYAVLSFKDKPAAIPANLDQIIHKIIPEHKREFDRTRQIFELYRGTDCYHPDGTIICELCVPVS